VTPVIPIQGQPAATLAGKKSILCVADLHLGYELELRDSGFNVPQQTDVILENLKRIDEGDHLLILGDLKHTIPYARREEKLDILKFFSELKERFPQITVVAGNHDGSLRRFLPADVEFVGSKGKRVGAVGFAHGHSWPSENVMRAEILLWAHLHPSIRMYDRLNSAITMKCWLRGTVHADSLEKRYPSIGVKKSIVMPAFNHQLVGSPVNEGAQGDLSPFTRSGFVKLEEQHAFLIDGVDMGTLSDLTARGTKKRAK